MKKIFVGGLPQDANDASVTELFSEYGKVRSIKLVTDVFSGRCRGFGFIEMEGHEARAAIEALDDLDQRHHVWMKETLPPGSRLGRLDEP